MSYFLSFIIFIFIYFATKYVNYYYKFYHIYKYLDIEQKHEYFTNYTLVYLLSLNTSIKTFVIQYVLIPIIKLNYMGISVIIALLYSLYEKHIIINDNNDTIIQATIKYTLLMMQ